MTLDHLWAGWRSGYVTSVGTGPAAGRVPDPEPDEEDDQDDEDDEERCVFCRIAASGPPSAENGVLWVGSRVFAVLNAYPYASGHLMVLPIRHVGALDELTDDEGTELWSVLRRAVAALQAAFGPEGINLGANLGQAAGAGLPRHLHLHAVPRWIGDTNFMTAVADTRVLPQTLAVTWERLHGAWPD